jgi:hypothetical protein
MARSRLELRKMAEAAEAVEKSSGAAPKKKKRATKRKTATRAKRSKDAPQRKRIVWGVFSANMKEEGRFPYDQRDKAEEKLEQLQAKSKKLYFIQPVKELLLESGGTAPVEKPPEPEDLEPPKARSRKASDEEE